MLGHVHEELSQMRSLISDAIEVLQNSFNDLSHESKEQIGVVQDVLDRLQAAQESSTSINDFSQLLDTKLSKLSESTKQIDQGINSAVRSLQFEDIVRQLTLSSEKHLDYLDAVLATLDGGVRDLNSQHISVPEYIVGLHELRAQIGQLEEECKVEAERSVSQKTMQQGEVELF
jgi:methyl-accepting chemotaxis protein